MVVSHCVMDVGEGAGVGSRQERSTLARQRWGGGREPRNRWLADPPQNEAGWNMGQMNEREMFSGLTREELQALFATLGSGGESAGRYHYGLASEIWQVQRMSTTSWRR